MILVETNLEGATLSNVDLSGANLQGAKLSDSDLTNSNFRDAHCEGADFSNAQMKDTTFVRAILDGATLFYADLTNADLAQCSMKDANLIQANLVDAVLEQADLTSADLTYAIICKQLLEAAVFEQLLKRKWRLPCEEIRSNVARPAVPAAPSLTSTINEVRSRGYQTESWTSPDGYEALRAIPNNYRRTP